MQEVIHRVLWKTHIKIKQDIENGEQIDTIGLGNTEITTQTKIKW